MKRYLPLLLVEFYLLVTLLLYFFGPVDFKTHNPGFFSVLLFLYHAAFISGYWVAKKVNKPRLRLQRRAFSPQVFYVTLIFAVFSVLLGYKNLMFSESIIPYRLFDDVSRGITEPGLAYTDRQVQIKNGVTSGSRLLNMLSLFFSFAKLFFIFLCVHHWDQLSRAKKLVFSLYCLLFVSAGVSSGTNSVIFIFFLFFVSTLVLKLYLNHSKYLKKFAASLAALFLAPVGFFGYIMSQRGGGFEYFAGTSPLGDINGPASTPALNGFFDFYYYSWVWLNYYLVQGYYGFSLILNMDWKWTYGFGNSAFLQRQLLVLTGVDISDMTFQARVSERWDANAQWHSFYGQFANDFGLVGLVMFMFMLGFLLSRLWDSVTIVNSFYGRAILALFPIMVIFFPANNLVLGYLDTISYVAFSLSCWFFEDKRVKYKT